MAFDVVGAYNAGYSDAEIADFLAQQVGFNTSAARESGYSDRELVNFLAGNQPEGGFGAAFESGVEGVKSAGAAFAGRVGLMDPQEAEAYMAERELAQRMAFRPTEEGWLEAPFTKTAETLGQSLPYMAAPIVGAGAGALAIKSAPVWLAAGIGSTALSALQFTGTNLERQMQEGKTLEETDLVAAGAAAVPQALLDTVALRYIPGVRRIFGEIGKDITEEQAEAIIKRGMLANMGAAGAKTGSAEALTEVGQQALERFQAGLRVLDEEGRDELAESAIGGGVLGFLFGVPGAVGVRGAAENRLREATDQRYSEEQRRLEGPEAQPQLPAPERPQALPMGDIPPRAGTPEEPQGELFPAELAQAQTFEEQLAGAPAPEVAPEVTPEGAVAEQLPLDLRGGRTGPEPVYGVDETRMGQELAPIRRQMDLERALAERDAETQTQLDELQAAGQRQQELEAAGLVETPTSVVEPATPQAPQAPTQPQQMELFSRREAPRPSRGEGMRREGAPEAVDLEATQAPAPIVDEQALDTLKLPKTSMIRKRLIGKDLSDPAQLQQVNSELRAAANNTRLPKESRDAIRDVIEQSEFTRQGEMFGPAGGILRQPTQRTGARDGTATERAEPSTAESTTERPAGEPSVGVAGVGTGSTPSQEAAAGTVPEPQRAGLADTDERVEPDTGRGETLPGAVTPTAEPMPPTPPTLKGAAKKNYEQYSDQVASNMATDPFEALQSTSAPIRDQSERVYLTPKEKVLETIAADIYSGENTRAANNVRNALPEVEQAAVDRFLDNFRDMERRGKTTMAWLDAIQELDAEIQKQVNDDLSPLVNADALPLQNRLDDAVVSQLRSNNLVGALNELAGRLKGPMAKIAKVLADRVGDTKVVLVDDAAMRRRIFERTGKVESDIKGVYFGADDTVFINTEFGLDAHTLLHETTHSLVDKTLNNKAHPLTKQLDKLFNDVKGGLDTAYGATDLKEFAAEFMSNPEFRSKLDRLHPGGGQVSALQRMVNSIMNFLRGVANIPQKKLDTAFSAADNLIYSMLQPGKTALQPATTMKEASFLRKGDKPIAAVTFADKALPFLSQEKRDAIDKFMRGTAAGAVKKLVKASLPLNALTDVAKDLLPSSTRVEELIRQQSGTENMRRQMIEPVEQEAAQFAKKASMDEMTTFNDVVYDSTIDGVDPTKPRETYAGDREKLEAWDALQAKWKGLSPEGKKLYTRVRDTYKKLYEDILAVVDERLNSISADPETSRKVKKDILAKLKDEAGRIDPYFPLTREGDYWLSYSVQGEGVQADFVVEAFTTPAARDRAMAELQADSNVSDIEFYAKNQPINYANAPSGSFMNSVFTTLKANNVDPEVTQDLMTLFLNSLPASSFAQSFRRRKGTAGYQRDAVGAFRNKIYNISRQLSNIEYSAKLNDVKDQIIQEGNEAYRKGNVAAREYADEFVARINYAVNPQVPRWSQALTSYGFLATLGFNLSSAVVNLSQIPLMVMPYYGGKYGYGKTMSAIGRATKLYTNSGFSQDRVTILGDTKRMRVAPSIQNYNFNDPDLPNYLKPYKYLVEIGEELGQMNRSQVYDILEVGQNEGALTKVNKYSGFIFHHGERMNREVALAAAYDLELQKLGKNPTPDQMRDAAREAVRMTEMTNGGIAATAAPRIAQNALGRVMFMYKRYGVSMYYTLFKMMRDMLYGEKDGVRAAARAQIGGVLLSSVMLAGVQGLPMYGTAALIYNMFKDDDDDDADTEVRKFLGEGLYKGPVNLLTGVDVASRIGLSDLLFRANPVQREQEPMAEIMELIGGPVYSVANRALRGVRDIREGEVQRGVEQILPSAFGNVLKTLRFATEGATTRRGDPIVEDIGPASAVGQFFGFAPADYIQQLEINAAQKGLERSKNERRSKLMRQYYLATRESDSREAQQIMAEISEFNQRNPAFAITADSLRRSMRQHARTTSEMYGGVRYSKRYLPEFLEAMREYEGE